MRKIFLKKVILLTVCAVLIFTLTACNKAEAAYDDDLIIAGNFSSYVYKEDTKTVVNNQYMHSAKYFSGVSNIDRFAIIDVPENPTFNYNVTLNSGRYKLVLVKDKKVYVISEGAVSSPVSIDIPAGKYVLKQVGSKADFKLEIDYNNFILS